MSTTAAAQYCHILKADKTATEFLTKGRLWRASDTGLQRVRDLLSLPYCITQHLNMKRLHLLKSNLKK